MKVFMIAVVLAAMVGSLGALGAFIVGCGPQQHYCPESTTGQCNSADTGVAPPTPDSGAGDAVILGND